MKLHTINTGNFKLDGGAMFGVVPKSIWNKLNPADQNNMCNWAMRCLLIESGNRLILIDTGLGDKQNEKFFSFYFLSGNDSLKKSIENAGFSMEQITDVFLTHLHFDHCGGAIVRDKSNDKFIPAFPNATYWSNQNHWNWAVHPNNREKASFLKENILPIEESGQLKFLNDGDFIIPELDFITVNGHTEAMMLPRIKYNDLTVLYMADLIPSIGHLPLPYIMGYDVRPLMTLTEKELILTEAVNKNYTLFFEHDPLIECCTLENTDRGIRAKSTFTLNEIL
jgi:glyoxylase-like metal-dependent hydrolase (beta-lactamase superfamily II)